MEALSAKQTETGEYDDVAESASLANFKQHELAPEQSAAAEHFLPAATELGGVPQLLPGCAYGAPPLAPALTKVVDDEN